MATVILKVGVLQKDAVELDFPEEFDLSAVNVVVLDPESIGFEAGDDNVRLILAKLATAVGASASPGYSLGASGNTVNAWLKRVGGATSNKTGLPVNLVNAKIIGVNFGAEDPSTADLNIYWHEGGSVNLTFLETVTIPNVRTHNAIVDINIPQGKQIAVFLNGNSKNPGVDLQLSGEKPVV